MYLRSVFSQDDRETQLDVIRENGWGHIVGVQNGVPFASHHPFLLAGEVGQERLDFHLARANPHWETFTDGDEKLVVFEGPKHYVTPNWCEAERALPTWAFVSVHVYGRPTLVDDPEKVWAGQKRLVDFRETQFDTPWQMESVAGEWLDGMMRAIVSFEMPIERIEANFRLLQNRPTGDRRRVADALAELDDTHAKGVATLIRRYSLEAAE